MALHHFSMGYTRIFIIIIRNYEALQKIYVKKISNRMIQKVFVVSGYRFCFVVLQS